MVALASCPELAASSRSAPNWSTDRDTTTKLGVKASRRSGNFGTKLTKEEVMRVIAPLVEKQYEAVRALLLIT